MKISKKRLKRIVKESIRSLNEEAISVKKGDTLGKIAKDNNLSLQDLLALNPQFDPNKLKDWQRGSNPDENDKVGNKNRNPNWIFPGEDINISKPPQEKPKAPPKPSQSVESQPAAKTVSAVEPKGDLEVQSQEGKVVSPVSSGDDVSPSTASKGVKSNPECKDDMLGLLGSLEGWIEQVRQRIDTIYK